MYRIEENVCCCKTVIDIQNKEKIYKKINAVGDAHIRKMLDMCVNHMQPHIMKTNKKRLYSEVNIIIHQCQSHEKNEANKIKFE